MRIAAMISRTLRRVRTVPMIAVLAAAFAPGFVRGQATAPAIGTKAVIKPGAVLKVGDRVVDAGKRPSIYVVDRAKGDWLWLTSGATGGWARAADVVPLDRAVLETVVALISRGNAATVRGDFERAIADYDEALRLDPGDGVAQMNRGIARQSQGNFDGAIADYDGAIERGLRTAQAYNNRGQARERKKQYGEAIADYDKAIRLESNYLLAWLNRGRARQAEGEFDKALADYEAAIRLDPRSPWGYAFQASIYSTSAEPKYRDGPRAVVLARRACDLGAPGDAYLCGVRAAAHDAAGEPDRATEWRAKARQAASKAADGGSSAGRVRLKPDRVQQPLDAPTSVVSVGEPRTGSTTAVAPRGGDANIGYLSSIPSDYKGSEHAPLLQGPGLVGQPPVYRDQPPVTWLQQAMQRNQDEVRTLERGKQELDNLLQGMQQGQQQMFFMQQQQQRLQQP
jgi:tetratricopeptide (TPR) repeat protein